MAILLVPLLVATAPGLIGCANSRGKPLYEVSLSKTEAGTAAVKLSNANESYAYTCVFGEPPQSVPYAVDIATTQAVPITLSSGFAHISTEVEADILPPSLRPPWWVIRNHAAFAGADGTEFIFQSLPAPVTGIANQPTRVILLSGPPSKARYGDIANGAWVQRGTLSEAETFVEFKFTAGPAGGSWGWTVPASYNGNTEIEALVVQAKALVSP